MKFDPKIENALRERSILQFTEIQKQAIPEIMQGRNVLIISPTGSGKTEAAMLPIFQKILNHRTKGVSCIYITPLRALNRDMLLRLEQFGKSIGLRIAVRHGDTTQSERRKLSLNPPDVLITTPETFQIMFLGSRLRESLKNVRFVIVDEVHELASDERGIQLSIAMERLKRYTKFQIIGLSATVGNSDEIARFFCPSKNIHIIEISRKKNMKIEIRAPSGKNTHEASVMGCDTMYASTLVDMWKNAEKHNTTLLFVNTRCTAEDIGMRYNLWLKKPPVAVHHGSLSREHRIHVENDFKAGKLKMLICTSSLELGIDVGVVDMVMQYSSPRQVTKFVQRVGRSGHGVEGVPEGIIYGDNPIELWESAAIAKLAGEGWVESVKIRNKPLIVLFNQIIAMAIEKSKVNAREAYDLIHNSYAFRELSWDEFESVLLFAKENHKLWYDGFEFGKTRGGMAFFYENISMIPDEKSYKVVSTANQFIGMLDERFVSSLNLGETFVMGGKTWRVITESDDKITVEYINDISIPPSWLGEEIPVPYEIAQEEPSYDNLNAQARKILEKFSLWRKNEITVEYGDGFIFMGIRGGTKPNYTLGLILSSILSQKIGEAVEFSVTPYSIAFFNVHVSDSDIILLLQKLTNVEGILKIISRNSRAFRYTFLHVAKKMGVIRKDSSISAGRMDKIIDVYKNSILYKEAVNKLMHDHMDVEHTEHLLAAIHDGKIKIKSRALSKEAEVLLQAKGDTASPILATRPVLEAVERRLLNEEMLFLCLSCRRSVHMHVRDFHKAVCPFCGSVKVVILKPYEEGLVRKIRDGNINNLRRDEIERLSGISHLLRRHRMVGAMVLAGRGIGLKTAARVLAIPYTDRIEVVKRVLKEELKFAKNRQFWD